MTSIYIIAEAGVNHNGDRDLAFKLIDEAVKAGADAVKFQTFSADSLVTESAAKAEYQKKSTCADESQYQMLKRLELSESVHLELLLYCQEKGIEFLSSAFDDKSLSFLVDGLGLKTLKIPSGELTNAPLVLAHAQTGCDLIVSTGMATIDEVEEALGVIAYGFLAPSLEKSPNQRMFESAYLSEEGQRLLKQKVILLHCTTEYPAPAEEINLSAMDTMRDIFGVRVGYSDHSDGIAVSVAAAARGAVLIEKHFTLDKSMDGPDHRASLDPKELSMMVNAVRFVEKAIGNGIKKPTASEMANKLVARKSIVASARIEEGELFTADNITTKRPGGGVSPMQFWSLLGCESKVKYEIGELIDE